METTGCSGNEWAWLQVLDQHLCLHAAPCSSLWCLVLTSRAGKGQEALHVHSLNCESCKTSSRNCHLILIEMTPCCGKQIELHGPVAISRQIHDGAIVTEINEMLVIAPLNCNEGKVITTPQRVTTGIKKPLYTIYMVNTRRWLRGSWEKKGTVAGIFLLPQQFAFNYKFSIRRQLGFHLQNDTCAAVSAQL